MEAQGSTIYLAEKAGRTISVTVTGASGKTTITIGVQDGE
jgi:UDP-N-acetylmuramate-alanine ligase